MKDFIHKLKTIKLNFYYSLKFFDSIDIEKKSSKNKKIDYELIL